MPALEGGGRPARRFLHLHLLANAVQGGMLQCEDDVDDGHGSDGPGPLLSTVASFLLCACDGQELYALATPCVVIAWVVFYTGVGKLTSSCTGTGQKQMGRLKRRRRRRRRLIQTRRLRLG